jgi:hypothetical protein
MEDEFAEERGRDAIDVDGVPVAFVHVVAGLDGWELICGLWRAAPEGQRSAALLDMAALVPLIPGEVGDWVGFDAPGAMETHRNGLRHWRRTVDLP